VIEHNLDVIKTADWIIDLGPEGGDNGGRVVTTGTPEQVAGASGSYTGIHLREKLRADAEHAASRRRRSGAKRVSASEEARHAEAHSP